MIDEVYLTGENLSIDRQNFAESWNFQLPLGKWTSLIGASGAGKSTLLDIIAGFHPLKFGRLRIGDTDVTSLSIAKRNIAYLFQESSLFPRLDVFNNLLLAMHDRDLTKAEKHLQITSVLAELEIKPKMNAFPQNLSGGEKARVELARSILRGSELLLLDEPFGALDPRLRRQMLILLRKLQKKFNLTVVCVSHNPEDSYLVADHVIAMHQGKILMSQALNQVMSNPQYREVVDLLQLGFVSQQPDGLWFIPHHSLLNSFELSREALSNAEQQSLNSTVIKPDNGDIDGKYIRDNRLIDFSQDADVNKKLRVISLKEYSIVTTPSGQCLLDMETGVLYPQRQVSADMGKFYFLEDQCLKLKSF